MSFGRALAVVAACGLIVSNAGTQASQSGQAPTEKKWDITADLGPTQKVAFDTTEGTWMNLDVSPDGRQIVFDLLGDLYVMPIAGSSSTPATRLTSGPAFDMQPRFSPDGKRIAFTSDRDGLWNIWTIDADGKNPKQVSKERRWFINSPTWSADGNYIFARRHFVQTRSLGAGEIWMFHASGSEGLQVTDKNGWQKDAGEPAISPDGKYLYYSKDVTPGQQFEYNKDPNGTIYAVIRRDLATGHERSFVSNPGRLGHAEAVARWQVARLHPSSSTRQPVVRARPRHRTRSIRVRSSRQGSAGGVGRARALSAIRLDAGQQGDRRLGRGEDLARGRRDLSGNTRTVHRARRADRQRRGAVSAKGLHPRVPGEDAA